METGSSSSARARGWTDARPFHASELVCAEEDPFAVANQHVAERVISASQGTSWARAWARNRGCKGLPNSWLNGGAARCRNLPAGMGKPRYPLARGLVVSSSHPLASAMHDSLQ